MNLKEKIYEKIVLLQICIIMLFSYEDTQINIKNLIFLFSLFLIIFINIETKLGELMRSAVIIVFERDIID